MKLSVCIASRNRPLELSSIVISLKRLSLRNHEIEFHLGLDDDDNSGCGIFERLEETGNVHFHRGPRPDTLGQISNRLAACCCDSDVMCLFADNMVPITVGWDEHIAQNVARFPNRVLWWSSPINGGNVAPIIPKAWLEALDYKITAEVFPFWFDDTWLDELDLLIFGPPSLKLGCQFAGQHGATTRAREFDFWFQTFARLRSKRIEQAKHIAERLGVAWQDKPDLLAHFEQNDQAQLQACPLYEERFGDKRAPTAGYFRAKEHASGLIAAA